MDIPLVHDITMKSLGFRPQPCLPPLASFNDAQRIANARTGP